MRSALVFSAIFLSTLTAFAGDDSCAESATETKIDELECQLRNAQKQEAALDRDFQYLTSLAGARSEKSLIFFRQANEAFKDYVQSNCESERHDVFGGTLEDVVDQKCRRDAYLARRRLYSTIVEPHRGGFAVELFQGRPICERYGSSKTSAPYIESKRDEVEALRTLLDQSAARAAQSGAYSGVAANSFRQTHMEAERQNGIDADLICLGIQEAFCTSVSRTDWLSKCQTQIRSAFYKRASVRLKVLRSQ